MAYTIEELLGKPLHEMSQEELEGIIRDGRSARTFAEEAGLVTKVSKAAIRKEELMKELEELDL